METEIIILNENALCLYFHRSIVMAYGQTASCVFTCMGEKKYITDVSNKSFGWFNKNGIYHVNNKRFFTRPSKKKILSALERYPKLRELAQRMGLIEKRIKIQSFIGPKPEHIWMN